ncbi:bacteriocin secretion accessory protein [Streptococcus halichoeri]|uniref:bacteriocin secretion accessory protein n=1 Tax=Streptococcus halichoeri TaxID=254785 RepID=UPI00135A9E71|nr:bacteriocin secretion accessory protein [Streptococcus halichoeri]
MNPNLFKSAEFYQRRYHNFATLLIIPFALLVSFLLFFSLLAQKEVTVTSRGEIRPTKVSASIQSTSNNPITINKLINNQLVKKGDSIIQYAQTRESAQKKAFEKLRRQKSALETLKKSLKQGTKLFTGEDEFGYISTFNNFIKQVQDLELGISKTNTEVNHQATIASQTASAIESQMHNLYQQITEYEELYQAISTKTAKLSAGNPHQARLTRYLAQAQQHPDAASENQYLSQIKESISALESSIGSLTIQRASTGSVATYDNSFETKVEVLRTQFLQTASQQLTTVDNQLTELKAQIEQADVQLKNNTITAPETGIVHLNNEFEGKNLIPSGSEIAQIYPNLANIKEVLITYYVTSEYVPLLQEGQIVRLSLEKVGKQAVTVVGKIQSIAQTATKTEQGNLFKITALAQLPEKERNHVQYGLEGCVTSIIAKKTYFDYYKDKILNNF